MRRHKFGMRALLALVIASGLGTAAFLGWQPLAQLLAQRWQRQLDQASDEERAMLLYQISCLGNAGISCLVATLEVPQESVARAAKGTLLEELERWKSLELEDYEPKVLCLAEALVDELPRFGPAARCDAADLAVRILREFPAAARGPVVMACEEVLRTTAPDRRLYATQEQLDRLGDASSGQKAVDGASPGGAAGQGPDALPAAGGRLKPVSAAGTAPLAGGGLPLETGTATSERGAGRQASAEPFGSASSVDETDRLARGKASGIVQPASVEQTFGSGQRATGADRLLGEMATNNDWATPPRGLAHLETVDLMRQLRTGAAQEAEAELRWRGFGDVHLELARRLFDPDPRVRQCLVEQLPMLQSVDAAPWLLQLCHDEDPDVRRTAVGLIATTQDPTLRAEAERIARQDADPRLKDQAERIANRRQPSLR